MPEKSEAEKLIEEHRILLQLLEQQKTLALALGNLELARSSQSQITAANEELIKNLREKNVELTKSQKEYLESIENKQKGITSELKREKAVREAIGNVMRQYNLWLKSGLEYLMQSDKVIKSTILSLGMSGIRAKDMRMSFEQSADFVAKLGGNIEDVGKMMQGYADETGEARALTSDMVRDITAIGKGTGLGIEQATKLAGQFRFMGLDAKNTMNMVQGIVDTAERMGVNTTKVLKNITENFKKLNTYTFIRGSKGMAEMAINAERTRVSIEDTLTAAEKGRTLEGAIDMMAQLQVMGGAFAAMDPLQFLHDTRNDPDKITEQISEMTRGVVTLRKMSDGTFEKFMSPADRDRLNGAAKTLGISLEDMTQIAQKRFDIDAMSRSLSNKGLTGREKELVEGAAIFNSNNAKYEVTLAGHIRDISTLTRDEAKSFAQHQVLLKDRAREAMTFDEVFKATINELKSALLPLLNNINGVLVTMRPVIDKFTHFMTTGHAPWLRVALLFMGAGAIWKGILTPLAQRFGAATIGRVATVLRGNVGKTVEKEAAGAIGKGAAGVGGGMLKGGAGIGFAAAGVGAGIGVAALGIGQLAKAIKDVDVDKLKQMNITIAIMGGTIVATLVPAMFALGAAGPFAAIGLAAIGAAAIGVGFGINLAAKGIGKMAEGFATMLIAAKDVGPSLGDIATGVFKIGAAMAVNAVNMSDFASDMKLIGKYAPGVVKVGEAFKSINAVLSGNKDDYVAILNVIEKISKLNVRSGSIFDDLANLLKNPLKVEFDGAQANLHSTYNVVVDSTKVATHRLVQQIAVNTVDMNNSKY